MKFTELNLHPALASALAARGYDDATPVQAAVLDPANGARDLLVSSETGSGKTVAFGGALAATLLAEPTVLPRAAAGAPPLALVIVPTRELAAQVRVELGWLLQRTGLRLAAFTGGTPVGGDLRTLERGVELVIGTPGRLVDLLRRERLSLASLRAVVLDEADEMLDLGFREDLETLLEAAPAERRTLLLSATLPPEIRALARRFQRDALAVDPRKAPGGADGGRPGAHGDITYVAHLIAARDRLAAVVNVLRATGGARAIVFCTTREGVSTLHAALVARGFSAAAISGERAQAERDRALDQLRRGEVHVLVATNVAARGLHLPDVDLIVHADLPLNAESLTHRSGRTGRAGRKGTAVVLATATERRKAERLLQSAHVPPVWTPVPSAESIAAGARDRLLEELLSEPAAAAIGGGDRAHGDGRRVEGSVAPDGAAAELLGRLEGKLPLPELARRLLARELERLPRGESVTPVPLPAAGGEPVGGRAKLSPAAFGREGVLFRVSLGAKDNADPRWLLPLICRRGGVTRREVGSIRIGPHETLFEIAPHAAHDFAAAAAETDPRARQVVIRPARADEPASKPRPAKQGRQGRPDPTRPEGARHGHGPPRRHPHPPGSHPKHRTS